MEILWQDLRFGARMLFKTPVISLIAIFSLALGIGANTALFSILDAMLLKMLPVKEPERLVMFRAIAPADFNTDGYTGYSKKDPMTGRLEMTSFPHQSFLRMRERLAPRRAALSDITAYGYVSGGLTVIAEGVAEVATAQAVSGNYYNVLGVQASLGRLLTEADDRASASPAAVLSYRYWMRRFGGSEAVIGRQINLNSLAVTIVGVTPPGFDGAMNVGATLDVTIPIALEPEITPRQRSRMNEDAWWLRLMGRLSPNATPATARAELETAFQQSVVEHRAARQARAQAAGGNMVRNLDPKDYPRLELDPGGQGEMQTRRSYAPSLYLLQGVVGLVLLIACANVANLLLSRASGRSAEVALRAALGASRPRLIRQLLTESALLSVSGGSAGVALAFWIKNGLLTVSEWGGGELRGLDPKLDWRALGFTLGLSLLTGMLFGLAPAWRSARVDLTPALKDRGRGSRSASRSLLGRGLVVLEVALSFLLLVGAGLFVRTLINLERVEPGFNTRNLLLFGVQPALIGYKEGKLEQVFQQLSERLESVPGVRAVTFSTSTLLGNGYSSRNFYLRAAVNAAPDSEGRIPPSGNTYIHQARENFLEAMEIPLLAGRGLKAQDDATAPKVAVINQAFANTYFPNENPVGKRFTFDPKKPDEVEVVGLAKDAKYTRQRDEIPPTAYLSWRQELRGMTWGATYEIRTSGAPTAILPAVRQAVHEVAPNLPLNNVRTQIEQANETMARERLFAKLMTLFGLLAQLLAAIGLFGVMAYAVAQRTREIGVRMALGADRSAVLKMILRQGLTLALIGLALGLVGAYGLANYLESWMKLSRLLYGVRVSDPLTYGVMAGALLLAALIACYLPARRATKVDPLVALRSE